MDYTDKVVWITGASSGIGEAFAKAFNAQGAKLVLSARRTKELERVKSACPNQNMDIMVLPLDLMESDSFAEKTQQVIQRFGTIDVLINNGGISNRGNVKDIVLEVDRRVMEVNYFGTIALTKAVLPIMLANNSGQIAVISSMIGKFATPMRSAYAASKHALHGFFDALRYELIKDKKSIGVTIICPGFINTDISVNALTPDGSAYNKVDEALKKGMNVNIFAQKAVKAIAKGKGEVVISGMKERLALYVQRFSPSLFSKIITNAKVT